MPHKFKVYQLLFTTLFTAMFLAVPHLAFAQTTGIANVYDIADPDAQDGDILSSILDKGLVRTTVAYDNHLFGVLQKQPLLVLRRVDQSGQAVSRIGTAQVNVTTLGGEIKPGDYITSSEVPGFGQRAVLSGNIVGIALTSFGEKDGQKITYTVAKEPKQLSAGKVVVALQVGYSEISYTKLNLQLLDSFTGALFQNVKDPDKFTMIFRYIAAGLSVVAGFFLGFLTFSRSIPKSIEAIGRNPTAEKSIIFGIILSALFTIITIGLGITAAALILRL